MLFSVIVPVYNVEQYICRCIDSILKAKNNDIEIILVDDGSKDNSGNICDDLSLLHSQIKVIHKTNGGLASARNEGLKYCNGKYVTFVDSDDYIDDNYFNVLTNIIETYSPDIINFGYKKINNGKILIEESSEFNAGFYNRTDIDRLILPNSIARDKAFNQVNVPVQLSACMCCYKKSLIVENKIDFESERIVLNEDWLFNIKCLCFTNNIMFIDDKLYYYDTRDTSLSMSYKSDSIERKLILYKRYKEVLDNTNKINDMILHRLDNFFLESIYCCYIIELNAPIWNRENIKKIYNNKEFICKLKKLNKKNSTLKGIAFKVIILCHLHFIMKIAYKIKKMRG